MWPLHQAWSCCVIQASWVLGDHPLCPYLGLHPAAVCSHELILERSAQGPMCTTEMLPECPACPCREPCRGCQLEGHAGGEFCAIANDQFCHNQCSGHGT